MNAAADGDTSAAAQLLPLVYEQLRGAAQQRMDGERGDHTLSATALGGVGALAAADSDQVLAIDAAVARLEADDPEAAAVVRLRFFAGLSVNQAAEALGVSPRTAAPLWGYARAALYRQLTEHDGEEQA